MKDQKIELTEVSEPGAVPSITVTNWLHVSPGKTYDVVEVPSGSKELVLRECDPQGEESKCTD